MTNTETTPQHVLDWCASEGITVEEYFDHEAACNHAEDLDNGFTFGWRVDEIKAAMKAGTLGAYLERHRS